MKIKIERLGGDESTIEEFADRHDLVMVVAECSDPHRWQAQFEDSEVSEGGFLHGEYGEGATPEKAIKNYSAKIAERILVFNASNRNRREIQVPSKFLKSERHSN